MIQIDSSLILLLASLSLLASVISASTGMGGMFMLAGMYVFIKDIAIILPIHACVSGVSNMTRIATYYQYINLTAYKYFLLGSMPGLFLGSIFLYFILPIRMQITPYMMVAIGLFILFSVRKTKKKQRDDPPLRSFMSLGLYAAPTSLIFGANGALISPYLIRNDMTRQTVVATSTAFQLTTHVLKLFIIYWVWQTHESTSISALFNNQQTFTLLISMIVAAFLGTVLGRSITDKISEKSFKLIFISMIYIVAIKFIVFDGFLKML